MSKSNIQHDKDTLRPLESQINMLTSLIDRGKTHHRFPRALESEYRNFVLGQFVTVDLKIISAGLLIFVIFGWADFSFGGDNAVMLFTVRCALAATLFAFVMTIPRTPFLPYAIHALVLGIYICFLCLIWNITMVEGPESYFYHISMVPMQVFALLGLRSSYRAMIVCSLSMLLSYTAFVVWYPWPEVLSDFDKLARATAPFYILFWSILIVMASYLSFIIESSARTDYIKNRLLALEAERLQYLGRRLQQLSTTDSLTGIANRRYVEDQLGDEWLRCTRSGTPLAAVMFDVDYFKKYNDHYGHQQGDVCLKAIAEKMAEYCRRPGDVCARYGGEEFLMLLPETSAKQANDIATEVCTAIAAMKLEHTKSPLGIATVSIGVAAMVPESGKNYEQLIRQADIALYEAKANGRNQVCLASVSETP